MRKAFDHLAALADMPLCAGLPLSALTEIASRIVRGHQAAEEIILHREDISSDIYFLFAGIATFQAFSEDGQEVAFMRVAAPNVFGEFSAIDSRARSADVKAVSDVEYGRINSKDFQTLLLAHPQLGLNLARHLVEKVRGLSERVFEFGAYSVATRVRKALLRLAKSGEKAADSIVIRPAPTHYELATMLSTHREAVSRELASLARRGIIRTGRQSIVILNFDALQKLAGMKDE